eukprot:m.334544 g.334544  ORF g.334544 m.334544 type:complete len:59 (+) comp17377_c0_seq1:34-210(+)
MSLARSVYNMFLKRGSTMTMTVFAGAIVFQAALDPLDTMFDNMNKGKHFKDLPPAVLE